jgi:hypothetical protein
MTKLFGWLALAAVAAALAPNPVLAGEGTPVHGNFSVAFTSGTNPKSSCAPGFYVEANGIGSASGLGTLFLGVTKCFIVDATCAAGYGYNGSFTMNQPDSANSLTGTYKGCLDFYGGFFSSTFFPFHGVLTVTGGTGRFEGAQGSLKFQATSSGVSLMAFYAVEGTVSLRED